MTSGFSNFRHLGPDCEIYVRQISPQRSEHRLISNIRKVSLASAGFVVELDYTFQVHTLVEMDVKFPAQPYYYRSRGVIEWHAPGDDPSKPHKLGIRVFSMEKLDPSGMPMVLPPTRRKPAITPRISQKATPSFMQEKQSDVPPQDSVSYGDAPSYPPEAEQSVEPPPPEAPVEPKRFTELKIPKAKEVSEILTSLIGDPVEVRKTSEQMNASDIAVLGTYMGEDNRLLSLTGADIALANWLGAALAMIPKEVAQKSVDEQSISDEVKENTQEIFNINTSVLNAPKIPHHRFSKLYDCFANEQPEEAKALTADPAARIDFIVEVPGYGTGRLCYLFSEWHPDQEEEGEKEVSKAPSAPPQAPAQTQVVNPEALDLPEEPKPSTPAAPAEKETEKEAEKAYTINPPKPREVAELFTNLVGEEVTAKLIESAPMPENEFAAIGNFVTDDDRLIVLCAMDIKLSNWAAAALAMIPKDVAQMDIEGAKLSDEAKDNVQEILNISASIFNKRGMPHLRFDKLLLTMDEPPPDEYKALSSSPAERVDFLVDIPGYGEGTMACMYKAP
jgi:hypothetical protein